MQILQRYRALDADWPEPLPRHLDGPDTLVLAFGPRALMDEPEPLQELARAFPRSVLMGCSTAGEISATQVGPDGLRVVFARFDHTPLHAVHTRLDGYEDSFAAGARLAQQLPTTGLRAVFMLSTGLGVNGTALAEGLSAVLPAGVPVSGGLAGDASLFERTWVLCNGQPTDSGVTAVGLYGDVLRIGHGCRGGWQEFGPERIITRSKGQVLYELDGQPALALYRHYLGDLASALPGSALLFPLSLRSGSNGCAVVRTILGIDEAAQSMTFAGDMPQGATVRLMRTSVDRLVLSAEEAAQHAVQTLAHPTAGNVLALSVSCVGRRLVMGERTEEELEAVTDQLPAGSVHAGFYSYGEISPAQGHSAAALHNQTMTLTLFAEP